MARRSFFSFHYQPDNWRASMVRNMGVIEGNRPVTDNDWETVVRGGDAAIERWINAQMHGRSCVVVLVGSATAGRKWINYEFVNGWKLGKGIVGIHIHNLKNSAGQVAYKGANPFSGFNLDGVPFDQIVRLYDPPADNAYNHIAENLASWVDEAVAIRSRYS